MVRRLVLAVVLLLALPAAVAHADLPAVVAADGSPGQRRAQLTWAPVDPVTLRPTAPGRTLPRGHRDLAFETSPDGTRSALLTAFTARGAADDVRLRTVTADGWRPGPTVRLARRAGRPVALAWVRADRVLVTVPGRRRATLLVVDPDAGRVLRRVPLPRGALLAAGAVTGERYVAVLERAGRREVGVLDPDGRTLHRAPLGLDGRTDADPVDRVSPLVDPATGHVLLLTQRRGRIADVDPATGTVTRRLRPPLPRAATTFAWVTAAADALVLQGRRRDGDGSTAQVLDRATLNERTTIAAPRTGSFDAAPGGLLRQDVLGHLELVALDGTPRWRARVDGFGTTIGPRIYAPFAVLDPATGATVARYDGPELLLLRPSGGDTTYTARSAQLGHL